MKQPSGTDMTSSPLGMPTGFSTLDQALAQRGWPVAGLSDIRIPAPGSGELRLLAPALRRLTQAGRTVLFLAPPSLSYAPMLIQHGVDLKHVRVIRNAQPLDGLANIEDALKSGNVGAIVAWLPEPMPNASAQRDALRRLQLAARLSHCPAILFRSSPAEPSSIEALSSQALSDAAQLHLQADAFINDTVRIRRLGAQRNDATASFTLSLPPMGARRAHTAASGVPGVGGTVGLAGSHHAKAGTLASMAIGSSIHASFDTIAAVFRSRPAAPTRSPWPFKQRRKTPDSPSMPSSIRIARAY